MKSQSLILIVLMAVGCSSSESPIGTPAGTDARPGSDSASTPSTSPTSTSPTPSSRTTSTTPLPSARTPVDGLARVEVRDGIAYCIFTESQREQKIGTVQNDQVALYAMYGGLTLTLNELEDRVSRLDGTDAAGKFADSRTERVALQFHLSSQLLWGIWKLEWARLPDGSVQRLSDDDATYLQLNSDKSFQISKKGRKPRGTWRLISLTELEMVYSDQTVHTSKIAFQPEDRLEVVTTDKGRSTTLQYVRTKLTELPKAPDEQ